MHEYIILRPKTMPTRHQQDFDKIGICVKKPVILEHSLAQSVKGRRTRLVLGKPTSTIRYHLRFQTRLKAGQQVVQHDRILCRNLDEIVLPKVFVEMLRSRVTSTCLHHASIWLSNPSSDFSC